MGIHLIQKAKEKRMRTHTRLVQLRFTSYQYPLQSLKRAASVLRYNLLR